VAFVFLFLKNYFDAWNTELEGDEEILARRGKKCRRATDVIFKSFDQKIIKAPQLLYGKFVCKYINMYRL
jgi:hypothetical protein